MLGSIIRPAVAAAGLPISQQTKDKSTHSEQHVDVIGYIHNYLLSLPPHLGGGESGALLVTDPIERFGWEWRDGIAPRDP